MAEFQLTEVQIDDIIRAAGTRASAVSACLRQLGLVPDPVPDTPADPEPDPEPSPGPVAVEPDHVPVDRAGRPMVDEDGNAIPIEEREDADEG